MQNECWKPIKDYEGIYEVSNYGRVKSLERVIYNSGTKNGLYTIHEKIIKQRINKKRHGYCELSLHKNGKEKRFKVHRLVAEAFIPNPNNLPEVNHIDGNKENNTLSNLEWVTSSENQKHRHLIGNKKTSNRHIGMFNKKGEMVKDFNSILEAVAYFNKTSRVNIDNALQGKQYTAYGYVWKYLD